MKKNVFLTLLLLLPLFFILRDISLAASVEIKAYIFTDPDCGSCREVKGHIRRLEAEYDIELAEFDVFTQLSLLRPVTRRFGFVPREVPVTLIGDVILEGDAGFEAYARAAAAYQKDAFGPLLREGGMHGAFELPPLWAVIAGGLVDGVNPCAFAAIIFMALYLAASGRNRKAVFITMLVFGAGVFSAYFLIGMGMREIIRGFYDIAAFRSVFEAMLSAALVILAVFSFLDYVRIKRGGKTMLRLSDAGRRRINDFIKRAADSPKPYPMAFACGMAVSFVEMACTGQVYLPVITIIVREGAAGGYLFLLLYNIMFVIPLLLVGTAVSLGATSGQLRSFFMKRHAAFKLSMGMLFLFLAAAIALF